MNDIKTSMITFPAAALSIEAIANKLKKFGAKTSSQVTRSVKDDIEVVSVSEDWSSDKWNITVGLLIALEDSKIAYDQVLFDTCLMEVITLSVRFFNGSRSSTRITGKDEAIARHIQNTLEMTEHCEDMDELRMNLQARLFAKTIPPLIQGIDLLPVE